jgi:hypothetical protein
VWHTEGTAVYYALMVDQFATPFGKYLLQFPELLKVLTFSTFYLELLGPLFIFFPLWTAGFRTATALVMIVLQAGFGLSLDLGLFPWAMSVGWLAFLPAEFWDAAGRFVRLQAFSTRVREKARQAANRFSSLRGDSTSTRLPIFFQAAALFSLAYIFLWNLRTVDEHNFGKFLPKKFDPFGYVLNLDQTWNMFSPRPLIDDGWFVIPGRLKNGTEVDLFRGGRPVHWEKPEWIVKEYRNQRQRKYMMNLWKKKYSSHRLYYGRYLCRSWNAKFEGDERLKDFKIYFMEEKTLIGGKTAPVRKVMLWRHTCSDKLGREKQ